MTTTAATTPCFGTFDSNAPECKSCTLTTGCQEATTPAAASAIETAPVVPPTETDIADLETKVDDLLTATPVDEPTPEPVDIEAETETIVAADEEQAVKKEAAEELAAAGKKKPGRKAKAAAPTEPKTGRERTVVKAAAFVKDEAGKLVFAPGLPPEAELVVNAGDLVEIVNPRSKYNGQTFVISSYSEKYECLRGSHPATKTNADFLPGQIKIIQRAAEMTPA